MLSTWAPASRSTLSMTSKNTSFFLYLIPSGSLQETALVTAGGGLGAPTSSLYPSWVMYSCKKWFYKLYMVYDMGYGRYT